MEFYVCVSDKKFAKNNKDISHRQLLSYLWLGHLMAIEKSAYLCCSYIRTNRPYSRMFRSRSDTLHFCSFSNRCSDILIHRYHACMLQNRIIVKTAKSQNETTSPIKPKELLDAFSQEGHLVP